jgi:hypothetical protein
LQLVHVSYRHPEQGEHRRPIALRSLPSLACRWFCRPDTGYSPDGWSQPGSWSFSVTGSTNDLDLRAHAPIRASVRPVPKTAGIRAAPDPGPITDGEAKHPTLTDPIE